MDELIEIISLSDCIDFRSSEWEDFTYTESCRAFDIYVSTNESHVGSIHVRNETYILVNDSAEQVLIDFKSLLEDLRSTVLHIKVEGLDINEGKLIFQSRTSPKLYKREDGRIHLHWRGKLDKIPDQCNAVLMSSI